MTTLRDTLGKNAELKKTIQALSGTQRIFIFYNKMFLSSLKGFNEVRLLHYDYELKE